MDALNWATNPEMKNSVKGLQAFLLCVEGLQPLIYVLTARHKTMCILKTTSQRKSTGKRSKWCFRCVLLGNITVPVILSGGLLAHFWPSAQGKKLYCDRATNRADTTLCFRRIYFTLAIFFFFIAKTDWSEI